MVQGEKVTYQQIKDSEEDPEGNQIRRGQRCLPLSHQLLQQLLQCALRGIQEGEKVDIGPR